MVFRLTCRCSNYPSRFVPSHTEILRALVQDSPRLNLLPPALAPLVPVGLGSLTPILPALPTTAATLATIMIALSTVFRSDFEDSDTVLWQAETEFTLCIGTYCLGGSLDYIVADGGARVHRSGEISEFAIGIRANTLKIDIKGYIAGAVVYSSLKDVRTSDIAATSDPVGRAEGSLGCRQILSDTCVGEQLNHVVACTQHGIPWVCIVLNEIWDPLPSVVVLERWGVRRANDLVRIALSTEEEDGFSNRSVPEWV